MKRYKIHLYELLWGTTLENEMEACFRFRHKRNSGMVEVVVLNDF